MEEQDHSVETPKKKRFNIIRLLITVAFVLLTAGVVGGVTWYYTDQNVKKEKDAKEKTIRAMDKTISELKKLTASENDWKNYRNTEYGFSLTFTDKWEGVQMLKKTSIYTEGVGTDISWLAILPTSDVNWTDVTGVPKGYASKFAIHAFTPTQWATVQSEAQGGPMPTYLGKNTKYVFAVEGANSGPQDPKYTAIDDMETVINSFKAI